jgi:hypothetical protein
VLAERGKGSRCARLPALPPPSCVGPRAGLRPRAHLCGKLCLQGRARGGAMKPAVERLDLGPNQLASSLPCAALFMLAVETAVEQLWVCAVLAYSCGLRCCVGGWGRRDRQRGLGAAGLPRSVDGLRLRLGSDASSPPLQQRPHSGKAAAAGLGPAGLRSRLVPTLGRDLKSRPWPSRSRAGLKIPPKVFYLSTC